MQGFFNLYLDACRWWALGGALLGLPPLYRAIRDLVIIRSGVRLNSNFSADRLLMEKTGLMMFLIGTMLAGAFLPLSTRFAWMAVESRIYVMVMGISWTFWAFSVWAIATAFSRSRPIMVVSSVIWGMAVWMATIATGGG